MKQIEISRFRFFLLLIGFLCIIIAIVLGIRLYTKAGHLPPPGFRQTDVSQIQPWMTLPYISRTYGVPIEELTYRLKVPEGTSRRKNIDELSAIVGVDSTNFLTNVKTVILEFQTEHQTPPPLPSTR